MRFPLLAGLSFLAPPPSQAPGRGRRHQSRGWRCAAVAPPPRRPMGALPAPREGVTGPAAAPSPRASARARHYSRTDATARDSATSVTAPSPARRGASHEGRNGLPKQAPRVAVQKRVHGAKRQADAAPVLPAAGGPAPLLPDVWRAAPLPRRRQHRVSEPRVRCRAENEQAAARHCHPRRVRTDATARDSATSVTALSPARRSASHEGRNGLPE